ncbi:MAG: nitrogenase iron-molybdenum cofactor biosynthesis protein NifE [Firmicutes bacterium]|nr:nitrogenase iron-molybdenum cofactor biosynthesis protein NifE [Bacillota bacterium]
MADLNAADIIQEREEFICVNAKDKDESLKCDKDSIAGTVSQRACVYCGARVVLNPVTDAFHIVHGPIGCASYTWDIRGSLSSGPEIYRNSFSTDIREHEVIFGGEKKLSAAIDEIVRQYSANPPKVIFVYATCIIGVIGDDIDAVCKAAERQYDIRVIPVKSPGFAGNKSVGYKAACHALLRLMGENKRGKKIRGINFLGDFNLAGEMWILTDYLRQIGVNVVSKFTGDARCEELMQAPQATLNIVQCAGSMTYLAKQMEQKYGIPYIKISFFGMEDIKLSLKRIAEAMGDQSVMEKAEQLTVEREKEVGPQLAYYRERLRGKKVAIYVGGGFKAISLIKQFNDLGMKTVMVGTQTGKAEDYEIIRSISDEGTVILDDSNPYELEKFMLEKGADILVGGVKERPLAYKLGIAFCDHNHERKHPLAGFEGAVHFAQEIHLTVNSPVWKFVRGEGAG